jgi:spheroidene monooxygenase
MAGVGPIQIVTLSLYRFDSLGARIWAFAMMGLARLPLARMPDLEFWKLCGSGTGEGFTPRPETRVYAILCAWPDRETAERRLGGEDLFRRYRARASAHWTLLLSPFSVRGEWAGQTPFRPQADAPQGPIAALTRATLRPASLRHFWRRVPRISEVIGADPNVQFKIGIGEVPFLHQVTFSVWPDADTMDAFARDPNGPHAKAIRAVRAGGWFREELYARFHVIGEIGQWQNAPLTHSPIPDFAA